MFTPISHCVPVEPRHLDAYKGFDLDSESGIVFTQHAWDEY